ncbi:flavin reductase family protein [bacterium]|nr:flavin reductase family protein [bacterium]
MQNEFSSFDSKSLPAKEIYKLMIGSIIPRPIAFITTINTSGSINLAPFSYFNGVSSSPPCLSVSFADKPDDTKKDTLNNILRTKEFVVNTTSVTMIDAVADSAADYPAEVSELDLLSLETLPAALIKTPRLKIAPVQMECKLYTTLEIGRNTLVIGEILMFHCRSDSFSGTKSDAQRIDPLARLGGANYATIGKIINHPTPDVKTK